MKPLSIGQHFNQDINVQKNLSIDICMNSVYIMSVLEYCLNDVEHNFIMMLLTNVT